MAEKVRVPVIIDTSLINGAYQQERRSGKERRKTKKKWHGYERRIIEATRRQDHKPIDEEV